MSDDAICEWKRVHPGKHTPLDVWMGDMILHCGWERRAQPVICPPYIPEPRCPK